jgi:hypothetical protein
MEIWNILLVFFANVVNDILIAFYIRRTAEGKAIQASILSGIIMMIVAISVVHYVENHWYLIPVALGCFIGTYIAIKFDTRR